MAPADTSILDLSEDMLLISTLRDCVVITPEFARFVFRLLLF